MVVNLIGRAWVRCCIAGSRWHRVQERGGQAIYAVVGSDIPSGHHTPEFDIDEKDFPWAIEALATGIAALGAEPDAG
jgi:hypothetical protein